MLLNQMCKQMSLLIQVLTRKLRRCAFQHVLPDGPSSVVIPQIAQMALTDCWPIGLASKRALVCSVSWSLPFCSSWCYFALSRVGVKFNYPLTINCSSLEDVGACCSFHLLNHHFMLPRLLIIYLPCRWANVWYNLQQVRHQWDCQASLFNQSESWLPPGNVNCGNERRW